MSETQLSDQYIYQSSLKSDPEIKVSSGKRVPFVIDLNKGSYQNGVITIDDTAQLNGSEGFASLRDAYIMLSYKCGNWNVIDSMSLELNGKTIVSMADYKLLWNNIRAQTGYSPQYVEKHGAESFLYPDAAQSVSYSSGTNSLSGDGYSSNAPFSSSFSTSAPAGGATIANDGFVKRLLSNPPTAGIDFSTSWPSLGGTAASTTIANQTACGAFVAGGGLAGSIMKTCNYMLKIKLSDLHPIFKELDLMANPQIRLRFRVNQGSSVIATDTSKSMTLTSTTLASGNTCPRAGTGKQTTQLNAAFDLQLSASVKNAKYVILLPFAEQTNYFNSAAVQEFQSPFDSAPWILHPGSSIRNFNVRIGSTQSFDISHDYDFHQFTNEVAKISAINGDLTPELVNGLLDYQTWSLTNRVLIADVSRLTERDVPQAIQVQGVNAGCQGVNMLVLVISEQELTYDRLTGEILEFTTA
ncbi:hypothetical protein PC110_g4284 [Phytophthora cactorum]|uniref:Uncharacterized protein n=1 Tax=Phytophthora cactorum TaxID=29920 RepID=A0A329SU83_9STRA|nr:hypothetical protein PC110_g4284 [Phytophthora cactorum]